LQPTVPFLCTGVLSPDKDDWKKSLRLLKHLEQTVEDELTLGAHEGDVLLTRCFPDATFAVHADMKRHTGNIQTLGRGASNTIFSKQNPNTNSKSSTEAELAEADDSVQLALWTRIVLKEQGYESETMICQDNTSAMLSEENGRRILARELHTHQIFSS